MYSVAQLTMDLDNASLGQNLGGRAGLDVQTRFPREGPFPADTEGLVIDLDHQGQTALEMAQFVHRLCLTALPYPVAVHGYNLEAEQVEALEAKGILVARRLEPDLFLRLARAIKAGQGGKAAASARSTAGRSPRPRSLRLSGGGQGG